MSNKLPSRVVVGNRSFLIEKISGENMGDDLGQLLFTAGRIKVDSQQVTDCLSDTILHEIIHAIDFTYGASGTHLTEEQVVRLTGGLLTVLTEPRNLKVFNFLFDNNIKKSRS